jgi:hypothetical protein
MIRKTFFLALSASAFLALAAQASGQFPGFPQDPDFPALPSDLQKQVQRLFDQIAAQQRQGGRVSEGSWNWGGVRLGKADANLQKQLGLDDKEGLVVMAVDARSAADKAGLKVSDVLVKINDKSVPNEFDGFAKLVKEQKVDQAADLVVVRRGKEETIKSAKMPAVVQATPNAGGGRLGRPGVGGIVIPRLQINPGGINPFLQNPIQKLHLEMTVNGAKIVRDQDGEKFSGEYAKNDLKITVSGKIENARPVPSEVTVTEGKETKKYTRLREVPAQHRSVAQQLMPSSLQGTFMFPTLPNLQKFPGLPVIPGVDN